MNKRGIVKRIKRVIQKLRRNMPLSLLLCSARNIPLADAEMQYSPLTAESHNAIFSATRGISGGEIDNLRAGIGDGVSF